MVGMNPLFETKASESAKVDAFMAKVDHPLKDVLIELRKVILAVDPEIGEEIKWNHPTFFFAGPMAPSNPKEYRRYIVVSNLFRKEFVRLVFPSGAKINDTSGLLEGDFPDGRKTVVFTSVADVEAKSGALRAAIRTWLSLVER